MGEKPDRRIGNYTDSPNCTKKHIYFLPGLLLDSFEGIGYFTLPPPITDPFFNQRCMHDIYLLKKIHMQVEIGGFLYKYGSFSRPGRFSA